MQKAKETASDMAASAMAGMEKARATAEGKTEKWTTGDPMRKEMAEEKKDERIQEAEREKQGVYLQNVAARRTQQGGGQEYGQAIRTMGGEGAVYDDDINRPARGARGAGTRGYGTGGP